MPRQSMTMQIVRAERGEEIDGLRIERKRERDVKTAEKCQKTQIGRREETGSNGTEGETSEENERTNWEVRDREDRRRREGGERNGCGIGRERNIPWMFGE